MPSSCLSLPALALLALLCEAAVGYPAWLYGLIGHPVSWFGKLISGWEKIFRPRTPKAAPDLASGLALVVALLGLSVGSGLLLHRLLNVFPFGFLVEIVAVSTLIASRSLAAHVGAVATALESGGLEAGREAVSHIVGRDPAQLDGHGVSRAAIESLAENFSDGVVAPLFWYAVAGLPAILLYKAINTADSMIGHRNARYEYFGKSAARLDDLLNLIPARLAGLLLVLSALPGGAARRAFRSMMRDASRHLSPNAGWPEAAIAGALDLRLGGPRSYGAMKTNGAWLGEGTEAADVSHIGAALCLYRKAIGLLAGALLLLAVVGTVA